MSSSSQRHDAASSHPAVAAAPTSRSAAASPGSAPAQPLRSTSPVYRHVALPFARDLALDLQPPDPGPSVYLLLLDLGSIGHPALIFPASPDSSAWSVRRSPAAGYW